jgi:hypothetical protein
VTEKYNQQDGSPDPQPESGEGVADPNDARPAVVGERSTEEGVGGQGLGQLKNSDDEQGGKKGSTSS